jgi:DNA repair exonuclease SbcCD ATPase subunit
VSVARFKRWDKSQKGKYLMVKCPECGKELQPKGLHGHMRFVHNLTGAKLVKAYDHSVEVGEKQQEEQVKQQERQTMVDRISKLHDELRNVRAKLAAVESENEGGLFSSDEANDRLQKLYESEEERIKAEADKLLEEAGVKDDSGWFF